ncbi:MAG: NAD-dependent epimerase/dehydratase family protein, partial [Candidatus Dadabacteria bacterium]
MTGADAAQVLVTGGTGLVGRRLVRELLAAGASVRVVSRS